MSETETSEDSPPMSNLTAWSWVFVLVSLGFGAILRIAHDLGAVGSSVLPYATISSALGLICLLVLWLRSPRRKRLMIPEDPEPSIDPAQIEECWANRRAPQGDLEGEAKRLARLLVSELALYNQEELSDARKAGTVYASLFSDIERSRQMYVERTDVRQPDFYLQHVVESLCEGDPGKLGPPPRQ